MQHEIIIKNGAFNALYVTNDTDKDISYYTGLTNFPLVNGERYVDDETVLSIYFDHTVSRYDLGDGWSDVELRGIRLKRRIKGEFIWTSFVDFDPHSSSIVYADKLCANNTAYEYGLFPIASNGTEGSPVLFEAFSKFGGVHIIDSDNESVSTIYDVQINASINSPSNPTTTIGRRHPYVIQTNSNQYYSGTVSGTFIQLDDDEHPKSNNWTYIDKIMQFLTNKKTKVLKDELGRLYLIKVVGTPSVSNSEHRDKTMISFDWVEVGDVTSEEQLRDEGFFGGW